MLTSRKSLLIICLTGFLSQGSQLEAASLSGIYDVIERNQKVSALLIGCGIGYGMAAVASYFSPKSSEEKPVGVSEKLEWIFRCLQVLPQYKFIARPVYKAFGGRENPGISVPASFAATWLIMHILLPESLSAYSNRAWIKQFGLENYIKAAWKKNMTMHCLFLAAWTAASIPIACVKYKRLQNQRENQSPADHQSDEVNEKIL